MLRASLTTRRWVRKVLTFAAVMVIAIIIGLYLTRSEPVVYRFVEARVPSDPPIVSIFNPFRDRSPEKCAEAFLELMKVGECEQAMAGLAIDSKYRQYVCEQEIANNLMEWNLKDRNDHPEKVKMRYLVKRHSYTDAKGQLWVIVEKHNSHWQVTNYECWY